MKKLFIISTMSLILGGCNSVMLLTPNGYESTNETFRYNNLTLVRMQPTKGSPNVEKWALRSQQDKDSADQLIKFYDRVAWSALEKGDAQAFAVARYLGSKLTKARIEQAASTQGFISSLLANKDGTATISGGGKVYFPDEFVAAPAQASQPKNRASIDDFIEVMATATSIPLNFSNAVAMAGQGDIGGLIGQTNDIAHTVGDEQRAKTMATPKLSDLKEGDVYAASDSSGNRYFIERVANGIVLHNPRSGAQKVNLDQLNFMPSIETPSQLRKDASRIVSNINLSHRVTQLESIRSGRGADVWSIAPNILYSQVGKRYFLDAQGRRIAYDDPESKKAYKNNQAYRLAIDMTSEEELHSPLFKAFRAEYCSTTPTTNVEWSGEFLNKKTLSCIDSKGNAIFSKTYLIDNKMQVHSWGTILKDQQMASRLRQIEDFARLMDAAGSFLPGLSNIDGALRCAGATSLSTYIARNSYSDYESLRRYVGQLVPPDTPSSIDNAFDCAQGVGLPVALSKLPKAVRTTKIEGLMGSAAYKETSAALQVFDNNLKGSKSVDLTTIAQIVNSDPAAQLLSGFYNKADKSNNFFNLAQALATSEANRRGI